MKSFKLILIILFVSQFAFAASQVYFDTDGTAVINGERTFVIGAYRDPTESLYSFPEVKNAGFNMIHNYNFEQSFSGSSTWISEAQAYLTAAHDAGLGVFLGLPRSVLNAKDNTTLTQLINAVKGYDALWFWYLYDEPGHMTTVDVVENAYNLVKSVDPDHPTVITDRGWRVVEQGLINYCDAFWSDMYGIPFDTMAIKRDMLIAKNAYPNKTVWAVPEAKDRQGLIHRNKDGLYPSRLVLNDENTCQSYQAIRSQAHACISVDGMQGVTYYWNPPLWHDIMDTPKVWQGLRRTTNELKALNPALVSTEDISDINVSYNEWGTNDRIDELYGYKLGANDYPQNEHGTYWVRKLNGSVYVGATATYVPRQVVTIDLPFEFARVVQYPDQKTIIRKVEGQNPEIHEDVSDVLIWNVPDYNTVSFILNDSQSAVLRIDPFEPSEIMSYYENFNGTNGTIPAEWVNYSGTTEIQGNALVCVGGLEDSKCIYDGNECNSWEDYTITGLLKQGFTFSTSEPVESSNYTAVIFRVQDDQNYYMASIQKRSGSSCPKLVLSKVKNGLVEDLAMQSMEPHYINTSNWYFFEIDTYGSYMKFSLSEFAGDEIASIDAVDLDYPYGSVGVYSTKPSGYNSFYENFSVDGRKLLSDYQCKLTIAQGNKLEFDLDEDCYISYGDLKIIAENWLGYIEQYNTTFSFTEDWESVTADPAGVNNLPAGWSTVTPGGWWAVVSDPTTGSNALYPADSPSSGQLQAHYTATDLSEALDYTVEADLTWNESDWPWSGFALNIQDGGDMLMFRGKSARLLEFNMSNVDTQSVSSALVSVDGGAAGWDLNETWHITASVTHNVEEAGELGMLLEVSGYDTNNAADNFAASPTFIDYDNTYSGFGVSQLANGGGFAVVSRAGRDHYFDNLDVSGTFVSGQLSMITIDWAYFVEFAQEWLNCNDPAEESCWD